MERHGIKRVPIVSNSRLVGIITRANLVQALASAKADLDVPVKDQKLRETLLARLRSEPWGYRALVNVTVSGGVVDLWGIAETEDERRAIRTAAESLAGVRAVNDHMASVPIWSAG
jgi:osmotically-inducible protein OsmY